MSIAIVFRTLLFFVLLSLVIFISGFMMYRYIYPIFDKGKREESKIYKNWKKQFK